MPSLFRFILWTLVLVGTVYAILLGLAYGVNPTPREKIIKLPSEQVNRQNDQ